MESKTVRFSEAFFHPERDARFYSCSAIQTLAERNIFEAARQGKLIVIRSKVDVAFASVRGLVEFLSEKLGVDLTYIRLAFGRGVDSHFGDLFVELIDDPEAQIDTIMASEHSGVRFILYVSSKILYDQDSVYLCCLKQRDDGSFYFTEEYGSKFR